MQLRQYFLFGLTALVFGLTGRSSLAFSVTGQTQPTSREYALTWNGSTYFEGVVNTFGIQELKPPDLESNDFMKILRDTFPTTEG